MDQQRVLRPQLAALIFVVAAFAQAAPAAAEEAPAPAPMLWLGGEEPATEGKPPPRDALVEVAQKALVASADALALDPDRLPEPAAVHVGADGPNLITYRQALDGVDVVGAKITVALDDAPAARAITGRFFATPEGPGLEAFKLGAEAALRALLERELSAKAEVKPLEGRHGYVYFRVASDTLRPASPARLKRVWLPVDHRLAPAWYVELAWRREGTDEPTACGCYVSAADGGLLRRDELILEAAHSYRVYADATGKPHPDAYGETFPHPTGLADGWRPTVPAAMPLITLAHGGLTTADPWLPAGATQTLGNNVDAFFNSLRPTAGVWDYDADLYCEPADGDFRATPSAPSSFDYPYDANATSTDYFQSLFATVTPVPSGSTQLNAKIVQAFYATNWLHDLFYDLGFDEAAGNMQHDNFGRGGLDGDRLVVNAGNRGTFAFPTEDGEAPVISLAPNGYSGTRRDVSGFDFPVLAHEWTHVMFGRLTEMGYGGQQGALNEGTADFVGAFLTVREADRLAPPNSGLYTGAYGIGAYMNLDYDVPFDTLPAAGSGGQPDNSYYHGVRRYPYSADLTINPLTLRHLSQDNALPASVPYFDWKLRSLLHPEVHSAGEIWATALWQCARNLLADETRFTFEDRKRRMLGYLVAGLKLFPTDADYVEARNAILFAMRAADTTDYELCRQGFATRGLGVGAIAPARTDPTLKKVTESFSTSDAALDFVSWRLEETGGGDGDGVLDVYETGRLTVTLKNTGLVPLTDVTLYVPPLSWAYAFPSGSTASGLSLQPNQEQTVSFDAELVTTNGAEMLLFNLTATDGVRWDVYGQDDAVFTVSYDLVRDSPVDWLVSQQGFDADWTVGSEPGHSCASGNCVADLANWERATHAGRFAYRVGAERISLEATLATVPFALHPGVPFRVELEHDYALARPVGPGTPFFASNGIVELSVDGRPWEDAALRLVSGSGLFYGNSGGWTRETLDFGTALGGRIVQLRLRLSTSHSFDSAPVHWAVSHAYVHGAATPVFSSMYTDVH